MSLENIFIWKEDNPIGLFLFFQLHVVHSVSVLWVIEIKQYRLRTTFYLYGALNVSKSWDRHLQNVSEIIANNQPTRF